MPANVSGIEKRLWNGGDNLDASFMLKPSEYLIPMLGLIFFRYADYKFDWQVQELPGRSNRRRTIRKANDQAHNVLYLRNGACFAHLVQLLEGANIGAIINVPMKMIETESKDLRGVCSVGSRRETPLFKIAMLIRLEDVRDFGFFIFASGFIVLIFSNGGLITDSLMIILGADILIAGLLAKNLERVHDT